MPLEDLTGPNAYIDALNNAWPLGSDTPSEGDDHLRGIKNVLKNWALGVDDAPLQPVLDGKAPLVHTHVWADITNPPASFPPSAHTHPISEVVNLQAALDAKAPLAAPALTGAATLDGAALATQPYVLGEVHKPTRAVNDTNASLVADDLGRTITFNNVSVNRTLTVPPSVFAIGDRINVAIMSGASTVTLATGAGVTIISKDGALILNGPGSAATLELISGNTWLAVGSLE